ncbi:MAG: outer membrane lipoprotein-sorting protein [Spirochaetales bacterium]|nr:outer membrane lipoprotein-sorting protein [Spirochaetales bacterium]
MKLKTIIILFAVFIIVPGALFAITPEEIIRRSDDMQVFETSASSGEMRITDRFGLKVSSFNSWSRGEDESIIEFTSIAERGQKILRTEDEIYIYYPDAEEIIRMQGSALRQSMLGSDISYEDMTGGNDRVSQYSVVLEGEETVAGRACYVLFLTANTRTVPYPKEKVWIDKETFMVWKGEYYTKSGRLLKEMEVLDTMVLEGREIPIETRISDKMKRDSETIMIIHELEVNIRVDASLFSLDELSW